MLADMYRAAAHRTQSYVEACDYLKFGIQSLEEIKRNQEKREELNKYIAPLAKKEQELIRQLARVRDSAKKRQIDRELRNLRYEAQKIQRAAEQLNKQDKKIVDRLGKMLKELVDFEARSQSASQECENGGWKTQMSVF